MCKNEKRRDHTEWQQEQRYTSVHRAILNIGAFNIQAFGDSKMSDESVADVIINVSTAGAAWSTWGWAVRRGRAGTSAPALMGLCDTVG